MSTIYMLIGIPGSGKSTFAKYLNGEIVSPDEVRKELYGDISIQGNPVEVFSMVEDKIRFFLSIGDDVVYDATNTTKYRKETVKEFREYGFDKVVGIFVDTPFAICIKRNVIRKDRCEPVPDGVMRQMRDNLELNPPSKADGFDEFYVIKGDE